MAAENKGRDAYDLVDIIADAIVVYKDGKKELFDAIYVTDTRVSTGHIVTTGDHAEFIEGGGIPRGNILRIDGGKIRHMHKKSEGGRIHD
ncbi:MAG: hypothetical protein ACP5FL_06020 [Thermoplasmatota archaeon]